MSAAAEESPPVEGSPPGSLRIAIIGGGIGGAAAAAYLARTPEGASSPPHTVVLFERRVQPDMPDGGALVLQGEALQVLSELGHSPAALAAAAGCKHVEASPELHIIRDALVNLLLNPIRKHIDLRVNCEVLGVRETASGAQLEHKPFLVMKDGHWTRHDAAPTKEEFDLVIGADGNAPSSRALKSVVGEPDAQAKDVPMLIVQALVPSEVVGDDFEEYLRDGPHGIVGKLSLQTLVGRTKNEVPVGAPDGLQSWAACTVTSFMKDAMRRFPRREAWAETMKQNVKLCKDDAAVARAIPLIDRAEKEALQSDMSSVSAGRLRAWVPFSKDSVQKWYTVGGRCVLLGDAVHLMPPTLGWGASCAMGDAKALAAALVETSSSLPLGESWVEALEKYEAARRQVAAGCVDASKAEARKIVGRY